MVEERFTDTMLQGLLEQTKASRSVRVGMATPESQNYIFGDLLGVYSDGVEVAVLTKNKPMKRCFFTLSNIWSIWVIDDPNPNTSVSAISPE